MFEAYRLFIKDAHSSELYKILKYIQNNTKNTMVFHDAQMSYNFHTDSNKFLFMNESDLNFTTNQYHKIIVLFFSVIKKLKHENYIPIIIKDIIDEYERVNKGMEVIRRNDDPGVIILKNNMALDLTLKTKINRMRKECFLLLEKKYAK